MSHGTTDSRPPRAAHQSTAPPKSLVLADPLAERQTLQNTASAKSSLAPGLFLPTRSIAARSVASPRHRSPECTSLITRGIYRSR